MDACKWEWSHGNYLWMHANGNGHTIIKAHDNDANLPKSKMLRSLHVTQHGGLVCLRSAFCKDHDIGRRLPLSTCLILNDDLPTNMR